MDSDPVRRQGPERDNAEGEVVLGASPPARSLPLRQAPKALQPALDAGFRRGRPAAGRKLAEGQGAVAKPELCYLPQVR